jgi:exosortase/archaeosortase family protein
LLLVVVAAMGAYPAGWRDKSRGMLLGVLLAYGLGIGRLMALDYTLRYVPGLWPAMHGLLMPLVPVMLLAFYFLRWSEAGVAPLLAPVDGHER